MTRAQQLDKKRVDDDGEKNSSIVNRRNTNTPKNSLFLRGRDPYPAVEHKKRLVMMMVKETLQL